jgi:hypothetical protein
VIIHFKLLFHLCISRFKAQEFLHILKSKSESSNTYQECCHLLEPSEFLLGDIKLTKVGESTSPDRLLLVDVHERRAAVVPLSVEGSSGGDSILKVAWLD